VGGLRSRRQSSPGPVAHRQSRREELDLVTVLPHTTSLRGNRWELSIPKPFLKPGAFQLQQIQSVSTVKLERKPGNLTAEEMNRVLDAVAERLRL
jgi:mRNA interferase MazF